jgi:hypothetical protein
MTVSEQDTIRAQMQELLDRQEISALLIEFAHLLDTKDWQHRPDLFADDGVLELRFAGMTRTKQDLINARETGSGLRRYRLTQHFSANHRIEINGDTAHSRSYMLAIHMFEDKFKHADAGGYYECDYTKTPDGWKFSRVVCDITWTAGEPLLSFE